MSPPPLKETPLVVIITVRRKVMHKKLDSGAVSIDYPVNTGNGKYLESTPIIKLALG